VTPGVPVTPGAETGAPALTVAGLHAGYGRIEVLHGVDLVVPAGSVFALIGPNGAGKSSLLKVMSGRLRATQGSVEIDGRRVGQRGAETLVRHGLCSIPEGRGIFPNLTVRENLRMWTYKKGVSLHEVEARTYEVFPRLASRNRQLAGTLSGGEQQMLAVSRALVTGPRVLLLDELSMGLAPLIVGELYEVVGRMATEGVTVLVVEQFVTTALAVATRAAIMVHGRIVREGSPDEMADAALGAYLTGAAPD
jgi:branched-chain amino acid transport system ATP-binding protein